MPGEVDLQNNNENNSLFVDASGNQIVFFMRPCSERQILKPLIEQAGGKITSKATNDCIKLAEKGSTITLDDYISTKFVHDCLKEGKIMDKADYKIIPGKQNNSDSEKSFASFSSNDSMSPASYVIQTTARDQKARTAYTKEEDLAMMKYLVESNQYQKATGQIVWRDMEHLKVTQHSAASMSTRFRKTIRPNLEDRYVHDIPKHWRTLLTGIPAKHEEEPVFSFEDLFSSKVGKLKKTESEIVTNSKKAQSSKVLQRKPAHSPSKSFVANMDMLLAKAVRSAEEKEKESRSMKKCSETDTDTVHPTSSELNQKAVCSKTPAVISDSGEGTPDTAITVLSDGRLQLSQDSNTCASDSNSDIPKIVRRRKRNTHKEDLTVSQYFSTSPKKKVTCEKSDMSAPESVGNKEPPGVNVAETEANLSKSPHKLKEVTVRLVKLSDGVTLVRSSQKKVGKDMNVNASHSNKAQSDKNKNSDSTVNSTDEKSAAEAMDTEDSFDKMVKSHCKKRKRGILPSSDDEENSDSENAKRSSNSQKSASKMAAKLKSHLSEQVTKVLSKGLNKSPDIGGSTTKPGQSSTRKRQHRSSNRKSRSTHATPSMGDEDGGEPHSEMNEPADDGGPERDRSAANVYSFDSNSERDGEIAACTSICRGIAKSYDLHQNYVTNLLWRNCGNVNRTIKWIKYGIYTYYPPAWTDSDDEKLRRGEEIGPLSCRYGEEEMTNRLVFLEGLDSL